jgi:hypothetical protein
VTSYVQTGKTLLAVASWATTNLTVSLTMDWAALGLTPAAATIIAPAMAGVQPETHFNAGPSAITLPVEAAGGWLLIVS